MDKSLETRLTELEDYIELKFNQVTRHHRELETKVDRHVDELLDLIKDLIK